MNPAAVTKAAMTTMITKGNWSHEFAIKTDWRCGFEQVSPIKTLIQLHELEPKERSQQHPSLRLISLTKAGNGSSEISPQFDKRSKH